MADEPRHAAWHEQSSFAVRLLHEQDPPEELAGGFADFLDAFDFAHEWLSRDDVARDQTARLGIYQTRNGVEAKVWDYPPASDGDGQRLVALFGFDPVNWRSPVTEFAPAKRTIPVSPRSRPWSVVPAPAPVQVAEPVDRPERVRLSVRGWPDLVTAAWEDIVSRSFLVLSAVAILLAMLFADPSFLWLLLVGLPGLWWRRGKRARAVADADLGDWL